MGSILDSFDALRAAIVRNNQENAYHESDPSTQQLTVTEGAGLLDVEYRGEYEMCFDDRSIVTILRDFLLLLASPEVAPRLRSFTYRTDAFRAANGTYAYDIDPLIDGDQPFPNLTRLSLDQGQGEHGYKILNSPLSGDDWLEARALARVLNKSPRLEELVTPVPPNADFFAGAQHPLRTLDVDAGFGQANFIRQLACCSRFPELRRLVFTDLRQDYLDDWRSQTTRFEDYVSFFESPIAYQLETIRLQEVSLRPDQIARLLNIRSVGVAFTQFVDEKKP